MEIMEKMDYSSIILPKVITLTNVSYENIRKLKYDIHEDNIFQIPIYEYTSFEDSILLELSYRKDVNYGIHQANIVDAIRLLHYLPNLEVKIIGPSKNSDILEAVRLYGEGYSTLCRRYPCHTVKYVMEVVNKSRKVSLRPGFEDILVATVL
jgi:hypothetical protein